MSRYDDACAWLRDRGTETVEHPGGTLYAHLLRIHDRLGAVGHDETVRLAGLTHAAYGTDGFDLTLLDPADRAPLRALVGVDAERLVHWYGACDRRRTWRNLATSGQVVDRHTGRAGTLPPRWRRPFVDLSIVNELDVMAYDPTVAQRYGDYFRTLFAAWSAVASPDVTAEARRLLGDDRPD
ncbi:hypothetical protein O7606_14965 [Micromonospora sp. WMMD882]|uniref:DUF6817 domain-containing protein n=1 Tax=Micromonospora sp. WMMD882 TaxID=3015151 RepID=UPI00248BC67C|nr:hypothetical protein [Micromonospora sp. WMMD882]WBB77583.1 hypothetical protein O7606_14965 [Micromonospora sp. WMMD882]